MMFKGTSRIAKTEKENEKQSNTIISHEMANILLACLFGIIMPYSDLIKCLF